MRETKMSTHLSGGRLNVASIQESMRTELLNLLQPYQGPKVCITIDPTNTLSSAGFPHDKANLNYYNCKQGY